MKFKIKRRLFNAWYKFAPAMAARWLNRKLERAQNSAANLLRRDLWAADELEIQCEEAELPIKPLKTNIQALGIHGKWWS